MVTELIPGVVDVYAMENVARAAAAAPQPEHDPWWQEDLNAAPAEGLERLATERRRLAASEQAVARADADARSARLALVDTRSKGRSADAAATALTNAEADAARELRERDLTSAVVAKIEADLVAEVRAGRAKAAQAQLDRARADYDAALPAIAAAIAALDTIRRATQAEREAADALALAKRDVYRGLVGTFKPASGKRYLTVPDAAEQIALLVTVPGHEPTPVTDPASTLSRRTGQ